MLAVLNKLKIMKN